MVGEERFKEASDPAHPYLAPIYLQVQETMLGWKKKSLIWLLGGRSLLFPGKKRSHLRLCAYRWGGRLGVGQAGVERTGLY